MTHLATIAAKPCILCRLLGLTQESKTDAHHVRTGQGMSQRAGDYCVIPVCHDRCHQGPHGIHGDRSLLRQAKVSEMDLLDMTIGELLRGTPGRPDRRPVRTFKKPDRPAYESPSKMLKHPGVL
jgi:hypothetical protein